MNTPLELVKHIIDEFGPRRAGSEQERNAQLFLNDHLKTYCSSVEVQEFEAALTSKFGSLKLFCTGYYVALIISFISIPAALALSAINAVVFFFHFVSYYNWLDFLYPKKKSLNVIGTIEPQLEVRSTLIFSGHMDSTPEFIWWYWLKDWGIRLNILSSVAFLTLPILFLVVLLSEWSNGTEIAFWIFVGLIPATFSFFFIHGNSVVDGAQDNLSGIAVAESVVRRLNGQLKHTRIKMVSFGSEETGLRGSAAYVKSYREQLKSENSHVINLDGILDEHEMHLIEKEISLFAEHDSNLVDKIEMAFEANQLKPKRGIIPVGATDAASFTLKGIPALSVVALPMHKLHPTYHTRLDTIDCLSDSTLNRAVDALVDFAKKWDETAE